MCQYVNKTDFKNDSSLFLNSLDLSENCHIKQLANFSNSPPVECKPFSETYFSKNNEIAFECVESNLEFSLENIGKVNLICSFPSPNYTVESIISSVPIVLDPFSSINCIVDANLVIENSLSKTLVFPYVENYLGIVQKTVSRVKEFFLNWEINTKKVIYGLVNSSWEVKSAVFCLRLFQYLKNKCKNIFITVAYDTDGKADSNHHYNGVRLPPPTENCYLIHLSTYCKPCLVGIRGEKPDMNMTHQKNLNKGGLIWIPFKSKFKQVSKHGIKQNWLLEKEPHICTKSYAKLSKKIQSLQGKLVSSCSKSMNFCLRKNTSKPLATCLFSRCRLSPKEITKNYDFAEHSTVFS
jgi:hypothetical protein